MRPEDCKRYKDCSAQLCPMGTCSGSWYPEEDICESREFSYESWIRNQRKIARKTRDLDTYYTYKMLQQNCIIGKGISGLNPDNDYCEMKNDGDRWLKAHPEKQKLSETEIEIRKKRLSDYFQEGSIPAYNPKGVSS